LLYTGFIRLLIRSKNTLIKVRKEIAELKSIQIPIKLLDNKTEELRNLGIETVSPNVLKPFIFRTTSLDGFWTDEESKEIVFYVGGFSFVTPYSQNTLKLFNIILGKIQ